jgi:hypothetical protein
MTLTEIANALELDKGTADARTLSWHGAFPQHETMGYTDVYAQFMEPYRDQPVKLLEVGVCDCRFPMGSLRMWQQYFSKASITALDINGKYAQQIRDMGVALVVGDQAETVSYEHLDFGYDFIIEDGSHQPTHMMFSLAMLAERLSPEGIYFMEDIQSEKTKGWFLYDNRQVYHDLKEWQMNGTLRTAMLSTKQCEHLNHTLKIISIIPCLNDFGYLAVFGRI